MFRILLVAVIAIVSNVTSVRVECHCWLAQQCGRGDRLFVVKNKGTLKLTLLNDDGQSPFALLDKPDSGTQIPSFSSGTRREQAGDSKKRIFNLDYKVVTS